MSHNVLDMRGLTQFIVLLVVTFAAPASFVSAEGPNHLPGQTEAGFIVTLFKFVEWPHSPGDTATVCFLGASAVQNRLESGISNHERWTQMRGRTLLVKMLPDPQMLIDPTANAGCQILYLDAQTANQLWPFPVPPALLTVSNQRDFAYHGGMIQFIWDSSDTYRIAIHPDNVNRSGLIVSGALGTLADRVDSARFSP
jgi:hypothetical protein